ncbi:copia protein [Tanacetum coccineum]
MTKSSRVVSRRKRELRIGASVDTPMVEKMKLDEDTQGKLVDPTCCQDTRRSTSGSAQFLGDELVSWSSKKQKSTAISTIEAEYIALSDVVPILGCRLTSFLSTMALH